MRLPGQESERPLARESWILYEWGMWVLLSFITDFPVLVISTGLKSKTSNDHMHVRLERAH
jgi:hypothetical protein